MNYDDAINKKLYGENNNNKKDNEKFIQQTKKDFGIENNDKDKPKWYGELFNILVFATLSLVPIGLLTLLDPDWNWSMYATWLFWVDYLVIQGVSWYARLWTYQTRRRYLVFSNALFVKKEANIQKLIDVDYERPYIDKNASDDDYRRKRRAWERKIKIKLLKINNKYRINNLTQHLKTPLNTLEAPSIQFELKSDIKYRLKLLNCLWTKKQAKINYKINTLLEKLSNEWLENNIDTIKVRYSRVSKTILTSGVTPSQTVNDEPNYKTNTGRVFLSFTLPSFVFTSFILFLIVPLLGSGFSKDATAWFQFITKVAVVASSSTMVWLNSPQIFKATELKAITEREGTLNKYVKKAT